MDGELYYSLSVFISELLNGYRPFFFHKLEELGRRHNLHLYVFDPADPALMEKLCDEVFADGVFNFGRLTVTMAFVLVCDAVVDKPEAARYLMRYVAEKHSVAFRSRGHVRDWLEFMRAVQ